MKRLTVLLVLSILAGGLSEAQVRVIQIDPGKKFQTIDNFAAADAWSGNFVGRFWAEKEKEQVADWLFSTESDSLGNPKGIGLSLWRVNAGAGTFEQEGADILPIQRRAESFLTVDGRNYDWGKSAGQQYFMAAAYQRNCNNFLLFSNSPPVQFTLNGKGWSSSDHSANIKPDSYDKFAGFLADIAQFYTHKGYRISYISPVNEPQWKWNTIAQEGSPWNKTEIKTVMVALDKALSARPELSGVKMLLGETYNLKVMYEKDTDLRARFGEKEAPDEHVKTYFDKNSPWYIGNLRHLPRIMAGHSYHNHTTNAELRDVRSKVGKVTAQYKVDYHQSEWCLLPHYLPPMDGFTADWKKGNRGDIQVGLLMGRLIYSDFVDGNATAWGYWKGMELKGDHALVALHAKDGNIFNGGTVSANKILWALGNYSLFIRPGYTRVETEGADDLNGLVASTYLAPDKSRLVTVLVNSSFEAIPVKLSLPAGFQKSVTGSAVYETSEKSDLTRVINGMSEELNVTIPPRSLYTVILDLKNQRR